MCKLFYLILSFVFITSCAKQEPCGKTGVIKDYLGQEGCTLIIQDASGDIYVPENIQEFGLVFYDGQTVAYSFQLSPNSSSSCNLGVPVTLLCIDTNL